MIDQASFNSIFRQVGLNLHLAPHPEGDGICNFADLKNELMMSVELSESESTGLWIWSCQAIVAEMPANSTLAMTLLKRNNVGLVWCYYALKTYPGGISLNLVNTVGTPADDPFFAQMLSTGVLFNMRKFALETRREFV